MLSEAANFHGRARCHAPRVHARTLAAVPALAHPLLPPFTWGRSPPPVRLRRSWSQELGKRRLALTGTCCGTAHDTLPLWRIPLPTRIQADDQSTCALHHALSGMCIRLTVRRVDFLAESDASVQLATDKHTRSKPLPQSVGRVSSKQCVACGTPTSLNGAQIGV